MYKHRDLLFQHNSDYENQNKFKVKPVIKWAGGKTQLLSEIDKNLPQDLKNGNLTKFAELFIGSGAVLFHLVLNYNIKKLIIADKNPLLINLYRVIQFNPEELIQILKNYSWSYSKLSFDERKSYYYNKREEFNYSRKDKILNAALFIFLNRTCFNGLFRVNSKGLFNVPMGKYKNPKICDEFNILEVSKMFNSIETIIIDGDYTNVDKYIDEKTFVYFDPPYRPISRTSSFKSYSKQDFDDEEQVRLSKYCKELDKRNIKFMLSNSDPHNYNENDDFFDNLYSEFNVNRVKAKRMINSKSNKRGEIFELLIKNY